MHICTVIWVLGRKLGHLYKEEVSNAAQIDITGSWTLTQCWIIRKKATQKSQLYSFTASHHCCKTLRFLLVLVGVHDLSGSSQLPIKKTNTTGKQKTLRVSEEVEALGFGTKHSCILKKEANDHKMMREIFKKGKERHGKSQYCI